MVNFIETESKREIARGRGRKEEWGVMLSLMGTVSLLQDEKGSGNA